MQKSFWWWQCSDRYIISLFPRVHNPFPPVSNKPHSFCGHQASCLQNAVRYRQTAQGLYKPSETQTKHWGTQTKHCETGRQTEGSGAERTQDAETDMAAKHSVAISISSLVAGQVIHSWRMSLRELDMFMVRRSAYLLLIWPSSVSDHWKEKNS